MQIDWKQLSKSDGYMSLKAAYIKDVQESEDYRRRFKRKPMREKAEFLKLFNWVICRAKHYAEKQNLHIETVLNAWEAKRTYWWLNYYQECNQPLLHSHSKKPEGVKGLNKRFKKDRWYSKADRNKRICDFKRKPSAKNRWSMARKKRGY